MKNKLTILSKTLPLKVVKIFLFLFFLTTFYPSPINGSDLKKRSRGMINFTLANDYFVGTDRYFTGGFMLGWISDDLSLKRNPVLKWLPLVNKPDFKNRLSLIWRQNIYTPHDLSIRKTIETDRPYAGYMSFGIGFHRIGPYRMDIMEFNLGIVGPLSFAEQTQKFLHKIYQGISPQGWKNQLKNEIAMQIIYERKWKLYQPLKSSKTGLSIIPHMSGGLGNIYIYMGAGIQARFGWNLPDDFGCELRRPGGDTSIDKKSRGDFAIEFFSALDSKLVLRNIFLDGNTFSESHRVEKKNLVSDFSMGVRLRLDHYNIAICYVYWSKRFLTEEKNHRFISFSLTYSY